MSALRFAALPFGLRFALRDLRGDLRGFGIFAACIIIGVAAISGVSGLSRALSQGLAREGRTILGGDASIAVVSRELTPEQRAFLATRGELSDVVLMRAMARRMDGETAMIEIKAVDPETYPTVGALEMEPASSLADALAQRNDADGAAVDPMLMARLDLKPGDIMMIGEGRFRLTTMLRSEPDKLAGGVGFGPRVLMTRAALARAGLVTPGAIVRHLTRVSLPPGTSDAMVHVFADEAARAFPQAGWEIRTRDAVSPQFTRNLDRFAQLLTLIALTALVAGGAGVANAVQGFVERKRRQFAILKALGASGGRVFAIALVQILGAAGVAIALGLAIGALIPWAAATSLREIAQLPVSATPDAGGALTGATYGLLVTLMFALGPLGRVHEIPVAALLRDEPRPARIARYRLGATVAALLLAGLVLASVSDLKFGAAYLGAAVISFGALRAAAALIMRIARALPHPTDPRLRLALTNIWRPGSATTAFVVSIGLIQTLLVALTLVEGAIHAELARADAGVIPNFFFVDVPKSQTTAFEAFLAGNAPGGRIEHVPMMRGRIVEAKGVPVERLAVADDAKWALDGDRGITFSTDLPANSKLVAGEWWAPDHNGAPLVSLEERVAAGLGLTIGDPLRVNVMGREIDAQIASLRKVDWRSYGINFVMVFSPNVFRGAPYTELFTLACVADSSETRDAMDARLARETAKHFPTIVAVRVKEALAAIDRIAGQLAIAARVAASVAIVTAILALVSVVAAGRRARIRDAVVLKTLGATRHWLAVAYCFEFGIVALVASAIAVIAGSAAAFAIVVWLMKFDYTFPIATVTTIIVSTLAAALSIGLLSTRRALSRRPGEELREL